MHWFNSSLQRIRGLAVLVSALAVLGGMRQVSAGSADGWLITPDEAALASAQDDGIRTRALSDAGPGIEFIKPQEGAVIPSPAEILIRFLPKTVTIDLTTVKVTLLKFIPIDLTDRLKPYISFDGIILKDAKVPPGRYRVRIALADAQGKISAREISFEVQ